MTQGDEEQLVAELTGWIVQFSKDTIEPYKDIWTQRREAAKTLISLSSAALIFTITFSSSIIQPTTTPFWRYGVLVCWVAFIASLILALASLWFSTELSALPILIQQEHDALADAVRNNFRRVRETGIPATEESAALVGQIFEKQFKRVGRHELVALWLLRISLLSFGLALVALTTIGIHKLLS